MPGGRPAARALGVPVAHDEAVAPRTLSEGEEEGDAEALPVPLAPVDGERAAEADCGSLARAEGEGGEEALPGEGEPVSVAAPLALAPSEAEVEKLAAPRGEPVFASVGPLTTGEAEVEALPP